MIYQRVGASEPIRQGDIFRSVPRARIPILQVPVVEADSTLAWLTWQDLLDRHEGVVTAALPLEPVDAIVITQDCDAARDVEISLCEIRAFEEMEPAATQSMKARVSAITRNARRNYKWFYLPPDLDFGIGRMMAADFRCTMRLPRTGLEHYRHLRRGRLNDVAYDHFRERLAYFFRRYAYDEWYPLDREEMDFYAKQSEERLDRYPWQMP